MTLVCFRGPITCSALLTTSCVVGTVATANLQLQSATGLQLLVSTDDTSPVLRVVLPGRPTSDRSIEVLFPEHITVVKQGQDAGQQLYLFRPGRSGDRTLWRRSGASLEYDRDLAGGLHLLARATLEDDGVRFRSEFRNDS